MDGRKSQRVNKLVKRSITTALVEIPAQQLEIDFEPEVYRHQRPNCWSERCNKEDRENCI